MRAFRLQITLTLLLAIASFSALAELTYPVDHNAVWQLIDTDTCGTVGSFATWPAIDPDTYDCAIEPCGIDPGYDPNFVFLLVKEEPTFPVYDPYLSAVESSFITCGPTTALCYDASCTETDAYQQVHSAVALSSDERLAKLQTRATAAITSHQEPAELRRNQHLLLALLTRLADGQTLPTDYLGVNFAQLYASLSDRFREESESNVVRYFDLRSKIIAGTIVDGEVDTGWYEVIDGVVIGTP